VAAKEAIGTETLKAVADRGYFKGEELKACEDARIETYLPKPQTSGAQAEGRFGTVKAWMGSQHFKMKTLQHVSTEMSLHVLAYNLKRVINLFGTKGLLEMMQQPDAAALVAIFSHSV
jgi:hypothetical protein